MPPRDFEEGMVLTMANSLGDAAHTKWGGKINGLLDKAVYIAMKGDSATGGMVKAMALEIPIRNFVTMSSGVFSEEMAKGLLMILNGEKSGKGFAKILGGIAGAIKKLPDLMKSI